MGHLLEEVRGEVIEEHLVMYDTHPLADTSDTTTPLATSLETPATTLSANTTPITTPMATPAADQPKEGSEPVYQTDSKGVSE